LKRRPALRTLLGAAVHELPLALWALRRGHRNSWVHTRNRREQLLEAPGQPGVRCQWQWTSNLHVAQVFPLVGLWLMRRALQDWPIALSDAREPVAEAPSVSFVIGHRGRDRFPLLIATLGTIAAQRGEPCECIVVEQSVEPESRGLLPAWVRYIHTPPPHVAMPYNRSWALNVGAAAARGRLLVLHDNDLLVPCDYAAQLWRHLREGYEVLNLKRFIFYLGEAPSARWGQERSPILDVPPLEIVQNLEAGASVAISAEVFQALGGFDEAFVGWGGEDNEFWERAATRKVYPYGYLPFVHLWHAAQPGKYSGRDAPAIERYYALSDRPVRQRIEDLQSRPRGRVEEPSLGE